ncbi:hypothetical protein MSG28_001920 [Choristoneura fumiferana]|uniref:Uncharacterized protein n=1 Tax=Choristoneura fumiferana TaxID=7141 RepID=A0ACC0JT84_CHOFU|nr:hypothetical protein MSG28_001920 [Choristoneura fumiferana]
MRLDGRLNSCTAELQIYQGGSPGGGARLSHTSEKHPRAVLAELSALRRHRELCDVVLNVASRKLFAHSPYFRAMFTGELAESRATEVTIRDVDDQAMEQLALLPAACLLQLQEIQDVCCEFLKRQLDYIVSSDELNVRSEEQTFQAVMSWVKYNFLVGTVSSELLIRSDDACRDLLDEAKNYLLLPQERPLMQGPRTRPRKPTRRGEVLFAVGGWCSGDAIASVERFDPQTAEWKMVAPMSKRRCGVGVAVLHDLLYAVGGHDGQSYLNSIERYDPQTNQWCGAVAPTSSCRTSVGVAVLDGALYAVGGQDGVQCLNHVERYEPKENRWTKVFDPESNQWRLCGAMNYRRLGGGVGVMRAPHHDTHYIWNRKDSVMLLRVRQQQAGADVCKVLFDTARAQLPARLPRRRRRLRLALPPLRF